MKGKKTHKRRADTNHNIVTIVQFCQSARDNRRETITLIKQVAKLTTGGRKQEKARACIRAIHNRSSRGINQSGILSAIANLFCIKCPAIVKPRNAGAPRNFLFAKRQKMVPSFESIERCWNT